MHCIIYQIIIFIFHIHLDNDIYAIYNWSPDSCKKNIHTIFLEWFVEMNS